MWTKKKKKLRQKLKFVCGVWVLLRENVCVSGCVCVKEKERERKEERERGLTFKVYFKCRTIAKKNNSLNSKMLRQRNMYHVRTTTTRKHKPNLNYFYRF